MTATGQRKRIVSLTMGTLGDLKMFLTLNIALKAAGANFGEELPRGNPRGRHRARALRGRFSRS